MKLKKACSQQSTGQQMLVQGKDASVDKLVESPGFHPGHLPVQVRPEVPGCIKTKCMAKLSAI